MPTTYTHRRYGDFVRENLPENLQTVVDKYKNAYSYGLHGPDIFFYYRPYSRNKVNRLGSRMHEERAADFFKKCIEVIKQDKSERELAYIMGFICHYALDSVCHGLINAVSDEGKVTHFEIETELDRRILLNDGIEPYGAVLTGHFHPDRRDAEAIAPFFKELTLKEVDKTLKWMKTDLDTIAKTGKLVRGALKTGFRLSGHYNKFSKLLMTKEENTNCREVCNTLLDYVRDSVPLGVDLIENFVSALEGKAELTERFNTNFENDKIIAD